jgi:putative DNA primase/helicase
MTATRRWVPRPADDDLERLPPQAVEVEKAVLGAMLTGPRAVGQALEVLGADGGSFYYDPHRRIYQAMIALYERNEVVDQLTVSEELKRHQQLDDVGGVVYLASLAGEVATSANIDHHARIVLKKALARRLIETSIEIAHQAYEGTREVQDLIDWAGQRIACLAAEGDLYGLARPIDLDKLLATDFPPREWLLEGFLQVRDLGMIHAFRGIGKSRFVHNLTVAVASGGNFLKYFAPTARGVLLVDGELPKEDLQQMLAQAVAASDKEPTAPLRVLSADLSGAPLRSLATEAGRRQVEAHLDGISFLVLDSISTLCPGAGPENDAESWEEMQTWLLALRRRGITVLLVHHDNRSGGQRGTSKKEDVLSQVVQLRRPADYRPSEGARFEVHLTKARGVVGDKAAPFEAHLKTGEDGNLVWVCRPLEDAVAERAQALAEEGLSQREIAKEMGVGLATVNRALQRACQP